MRSITPFFTLCVIISAVLCFTAGCDSQTDYQLNPNAILTLSGQLQCCSEVPSSLSGFRINVYRDLADVHFQSVTATAISDEAGSFSISGLPQGGYYVTAWKDVDGDQFVSKGDYYGYHCDRNSQMCPCFVTPGADNYVCVEIDAIR